MMNLLRPMGHLLHSICWSSSSCSPVARPGGAGEAGRPAAGSCVRSECDQDCGPVWAMLKGLRGSNHKMLPEHETGAFPVFHLPDFSLRLTF